MKQTVPSSIVLIIAIVIGIIVMPAYYIGIVQWRNDQEVCIVEARNLVDKIIDTRSFTSEMESDFNIALASMNGTYTAEVTHEIMMVNPDPTNPGGTYTSYVITNDLENWNQGDYVTVTIRPVGLSFLQAVSLKLLGASYTTQPVTFKARVR